jgi:D-tyrosyl-tRNA(Tyr) deacylase
VRLVIQRVRAAAVEWTDPTDPTGPAHRHSIGRGLAILVGAGPETSPTAPARLAAKVANLRIFADADGRLNRSLLEVEGQALVVSQFTLYADISRGRRPSLLQAGDPTRAERHYQDFVRALQEDHHIPTQTGSFGADMLVRIENDGPVTLVLSSDAWNPRISTG